MWPKPLVARGVPPAHRVATVDVLPLDLEVWSATGTSADADATRARVEAGLANTALAELGKRAYRPAALIDWNGDAAGGHVIDRGPLLATVAELARYQVVSPSTRELPAPRLPARLGERTGADATLYIGGWSYLAPPHPGTAVKVLEGVAIAVAVVAVVAVVALAATHGSHGHGPEHGAGPGSARGGVASGVSHWHGYQARMAANDFGLAVADVATDVAIDVAVHPAWYDDRALPHAGGDSQMFVEMTLVDNRTGAALWHAHQIFPASGASSSDVARVARTVMASLPAS